MTSHIKKISEEVLLETGWGRLHFAYNKENDIGQLQRIPENTLVPSYCEKCQCQTMHRLVDKDKVWEGQRPKTYYVLECIRHLEKTIGGIKC